jgi:hypothetical protein
MSAERNFDHRRNFSKTKPSRKRPFVGANINLKTYARPEERVNEIDWAAEHWNNIASLRIRENRSGF